MYLTSYNDFTTYWNGMPTAVPAIKTVTVGADDELLDMQSGPHINYPHLRVETPSITYVDQDEIEKTRYRFRIFILQNVTDSALIEQQNAALSATEAILRSVYRRLWVDADANKFDLLAGDPNGDNIQHWSGDDCYGWYMEITLEFYVGTC